MGKWCLQASLFVFDHIFVKHAGNQDRHKISDEFEFRPDQISHFGVTCPCRWIKFSIDILWNLQVQLTFQTLEFFVTLFLGTVRQWADVSCILESGCCCLFIPLFLHFSFCPIFNIETLKFFVTLFSGTVRPRRLKLGTHMDGGQMHHVYQNQAAAGIHPFISSFFFLQFSTLKFFVTLFSGTVRPRRLKIGTHLDIGQMYLVYQNQAVATYSSLYFFIYLSLQFSTLKFLSHFSRELWGLEDWNLVHMGQWADVSCIPESGCCCLFVPLFLHFSFSPIFKH